MTKAAHIMEKLAGSGWDLRAYNVDPAEFEAKFVTGKQEYAKYHKKRSKAQGDFPSARKWKYKTMFGGKKRYEKAKKRHFERGQAFDKKHGGAKLDAAEDARRHWKDSKEIHGIGSKS